jgi:PAS domain S-box-containing protein
MAPGIQILIAIADRTQRERLAEGIIAPAGYQTLLAQSCAEVRALARSHSLEMIFLEEKLPDGDCHELAAELWSAQPALSIVLVTKVRATGELSKILGLGISGAVRLPLREKEVLATIDRSLKRRRGLERWLKRETGRMTGGLNRRLTELEAILKQVDDGVIVLDKELRVMMINQAVRKAFALENDEVLGLPVAEVLHDEEMLQVFRDTNADGSHLEVQGKDGRVFNMRVTRIPDVGTVASMHDISYLKELDQLKGDFVNTVSHDLRSPLTAILGYVELIERAGEVNEQQAEFIRRVKSSVASTTDLIGDLLNLGRVEVGTLDDVDSVQLQDLVTEVIEALMARVEDKRQTLRMAAKGKIPAVRGSRTQLKQAIDNLIGNAIKFTPEGGEIRVMLRREDMQVILHVADNGPGIPPEEQARVFEKFYRASNTQERVAGTGLGLAIVKRVIDNHRGRIWVDSKVAEGSIFTVVLPVAE